MSHNIAKWSVADFWICLCFFWITCSICSMGCSGPNPNGPNRIIEGIILNAQPVGPTCKKKVHIVFQDEVEMTLKNHNDWPIYKNTPVRITIDAWEYIHSVERVGSPKPGDTVMKHKEQVGSEQDNKSGDKYPVISIGNEYQFIPINAEPEGKFGIGSSMDRVRELEGEPHKIVPGHSHHLWHYTRKEPEDEFPRHDIVTFSTKTNLVTGFQNNSGKLNATATLIIKATKE